MNIPDRFSLQSWKPSLCPHRWPAGPAAGGAGWQWVRKGRLQARSLPLGSQSPASPGRFGWIPHLLCFCDGPCEGDAVRDLVLCVPPGACTPRPWLGPARSASSLGQPPSAVSPALAPARAVP